MPEVSPTGQQSAPPTERGGSLTIEQAVAKMQAARESAAAPAPETPAKADGGPEASTQAADAVAQDSSDGGVSDVETAEVEVPETGADQPDDTDADTKDPVFIFTGEDGEEHSYTSDQIAEALALEPRLRADYTKKTQAVAEKSRQIEALSKDYQTRMGELEAAKSQFAKRGEAYDAALKQLDGFVDQEGERFMKMDWAALKTTDSIGYQETVADYQLWKDKKAAVQAEQQRREKEKADLAREQDQAALARLHAHVSAKYPQWSDDRLFKRDSEQMDRTALSLGFAPEEVRSTRDPRIWDLMYKAARFDMIEAAQAAAKAAQPKPNGKAPEPIRIVRPAAPRPSVRTARATEVASLAATVRRTGNFEDALALYRAKQQNQPR